MTPLDHAQRQYHNRLIVKARRYERRQLAEQLQAAIRSERDAMRAKLAEIEANILSKCNSLRAELERVREEAALLREWRDAHTAHEQAQKDLRTLYRKHAIERAWAAERDPDAQLN